MATARVSDWVYGLPQAAMNLVLDSSSVLIADDHRDTADSLASLLQIAAPNPIKAVVVYDGMQAVLAARAHAFNVVLLDIEMPALDGIAAGRAIRDLRPRSKLLLIAMSGSVDRVGDARDSAIFDLVLTKPINVATLLENVFPLDSPPPA